jgi:hypothetical protein
VKFEPGHLPVYFVPLAIFETATGYSPDAVQKKIRRGEWREGIHWRRAPDGHIMMDLRAYHAWVEGQQQAA